jgi:[acyl-carrier-protein] S-malonyltransferase
MKRACIFPGQGSQTVGMCKDIIEHYDIARIVLQEVDDALNQNLSQIILTGPAEVLTLTENTQPALMACSIAILRVIESLSGKKLSQFCDYVAGHSLGEFTALTAANVFSLSDCARLLRIRGKSMQESVPLGEGAMIALLGAEFSVAQDIVEQASKIGVCQIANDNSNGQQVLSGVREAIDEAMNIASQQGYKAIKLNVSAPFHCNLMKPAQEAVKEALANITLTSPSVPLIANITAKPVTDIETIKELLVQQVTGMVRWRETVLEFKTLGISNIAEIGAGKVLCGLIKRTDQELNCQPINNCQDIDLFIENL